VNSAAALPGLEDIIDRARVAPRVEALLPAGVRHRQLPVRTLLLGMLLALADHRPAHLTRVHGTLTSLPAGDQARLGVLATWKHGPHLLTYRQTERTCHLVVTALEKEHPDGAPSPELTAVLGALLEASVPAAHKNATRALAVDWSDLETFSRPPPARGGDCADPEASWGHRRGDSPGQKDELFYGYYLSAATMVQEETGPPVPELARRMTQTSCHLDPARAMVPVLERLAASGVPLGDVLDDSGYAHRVPGNWAVPLRAAGAQLIQDLHPGDRGPHGTHAGAVISNGSLYCPMTPRPLLSLGPLARDATPGQTAAHDQQTAETARYKLGKITSDDADGYHRVMCPAVMGKLRCPLRPPSMSLTRQRPEILTPPAYPPACCTQLTITVPPEASAKTAQKHDYPSQAHRYSYARRSAAERTFSTAKDPATNDISRGWCRLMGLTPITLFTGCLLVVRNQRILAAFDTRQAQNAHRAAAGLPPRTRRRRRKTLTSLATPP
jgi:hypothetical protein